ncbi:hypothetical protein MTsPCn5_19000 [Croceitalea sp. MTPC5]|uniref:PH domain-containing protein n=1 Tax=Croceitalea sp. MTPC5 TaxID=3056565 RepID=UPI002B3796CA|nr:hypothetical protein MTsPCn5_19000 [Croceitalea sp. MTPC5]
MKKNLFWNGVVIFTLVICVFAFVLHYKNWTTFEEDHFQVVSGIYKQRIPFSEIDSVSWVEKLPKMERKSGFSWLTKEKGIFKDSLSNAEVSVFVDDLKQPKIRLLHHDSLLLYINLSDSIQSHLLFQDLVKE